MAAAIVDEGKAFHNPATIFPFMSQKPTYSAPFIVRYSSQSTNENYEIPISVPAPVELAEGSYVQLSFPQPPSSPFPLSPYSENGSIFSTPASPGGMSTTQDNRIPSNGPSYPNSYLPYYGPIRQPDLYNQRPAHGHSASFNGYFNGQLQQDIPDEVLPHPGTAPAGQQYHQIYQETGYFDHKYTYTGRQESARTHSFANRPHHWPPLSPLPRTRASKLRTTASLPSENSAPLPSNAHPSRPASAPYNHFSPNTNTPDNAASSGGLKAWTHAQTRFQNTNFSNTLTFATPPQGRNNRKGTSDGLSRGVTHPPLPSDQGRNKSRKDGRKKALIIGINYYECVNRAWRLHGCINDAEQMRAFLIDVGKYNKENIVMLTDDANVKDSRYHPTGENITREMNRLVENAREGDHLFFHYSGHGDQVVDKSGDEESGKDQRIIPSDFEKKGYIVDDKLHDILVKRLPNGCRLTALVDACHSGTALDLPFEYSNNDGGHSLEKINRKGLKYNFSSADVISWSGCKDEELGQDIVSPDGKDVGAMCSVFIKSLRENPQQTYETLYASLRDKLKECQPEQHPQLGSSHHIDTNQLFEL